MSTKITELPRVITTQNSDLVIVEVMNPNGSSKTSTITVGDFKGSEIKGPFENDFDAEIGGVAIMGVYYTSEGNLRIRLV